MSRLLDITPLRHNPLFQHFWLGTSCQTLGGQILSFTILYRMWEITHSPLMTGTVGLALACAMIGFGLWGGVLADTRERRATILLASAGALLFTLALMALIALGNTSVPLLLAIAAGQSACSALAQPSRKALVPELLRPHQLGAGIALSHASFQAAMLGGPALAGLVAGLWSITACAGLAAIAFGVALLGLRRLPRSMPPAARHDPSVKGRVGHLLAGFGAIWARPALRGALLADLAAMALAMPIGLFPALNEARFHGDPRMLGLFLSAFAIGGIGATLFSGRFAKAKHPGATQLAGVFGWGAALTLAGLAPWGWLTLGLLVLAGAADTVAAITRAMVVQFSCTPDLRGRILAAEQIVGTGAPQLGNFRAGAMASLFPADTALALGGLLCLVAAGGIAASHRPLVAFEAPAKA